MFGTMQMADLLAAKYPNIIDYGESRVWDAINAQLIEYNKLTRDMLGSLVEFGTERIRGAGVRDSRQMTKADEFGRADAQKVAVGLNFGFPLYRSQDSLQWTRDWMENHTPAELAEEMVAIQTADTLELQNDLRAALFGSSNFTFIDKFVDRYELQVKRLANADGFEIPVGPNGASWNASTHTHYLAVNGLDTPTLEAGIQTVAEHYQTGQIYVLINPAQETTIRGFTAAGQFTALLPAEIIPAITSVRAVGNLDTAQLNNRQIGFYGNRAARVWVKPWIPANYILIFIVGAGRRILFARERRPNSSVLRLVADNELFPLRAQTYQREIGFGVQDRVAGAAIYCGGSTYVDPTF